MKSDESGKPAEFPEVLKALPPRHIEEELRSLRASIDAVHTTRLNMNELLAQYEKGELTFSQLLCNLLHQYESLGKNDREKLQNALFAFAVFEMKS